MISDAPEKKFPVPEETNPVSLAIEVGIVKVMEAASVSTVKEREVVEFCPDASENASDPIDADFEIDEAVLLSFEEYFLSGLSVDVELMEIVSAAREMTVPPGFKAMASNDEIDASLTGAL